MLPSFSRGLRLALVLAVSAGYIGWQGHAHSAYAGKKGGDDSDSDSDQDDSDSDSDDSDKGDKGDDSGGDEDNPDDKDQPPVTAGGLFTLATYPQSELMRPLTMTQHITQLRLGIGTDISAKGAFGTAGVSLEAIHGLTDNFSLIGGFTNAYNMRQFNAYFGFEGALVYDLLDIRIDANVHRNAITRYSLFCDPPATPNEVVVNGTCTNAGATQDNLPNGHYNAGGTKFSVDIGFPLRYDFIPQFAVIALQTLMTIDFNSADRDFVEVTPIDGATPPMPTTVSTVKPNGVKPDLNPSIGLQANPIPQLSLTIFAQLRVPDFDTAAGAFQVPVTARIEASPSQKFDVGLEFTLLNVNAPTGQSPIDNRFISLFAQARFGR